MNSANAWSIELGRSLSVSALLIAAHSIAVGALVVSVEPLVAAVAGCAIAVSAARSLRLHGWRSASAAVVRLSIGEDGSVQLTARDAANESGALDLRSTVYPWLVIVRLKRRGVLPGRTVIVPRDCVTTEAHRQLRAHLKWLRLGEQDASERSALR